MGRGRALLVPTRLGLFRGVSEPPRENRDAIAAWLAPHVANRAARRLERLGYVATRFMASLRKLLRFTYPYWPKSLGALLLLVVLVGLDLSIPRLIQSLIDHGVLQHDRSFVIRTSLLMLGVSALSIFVAIGNNNLSV